jgi:hypothetical protein
VSVLKLTVVVKSTDRSAAVERYSKLLESEALGEFAIEGTGLTVTLFPGLSVLSGSAKALAQADGLVASTFVDSLEKTRAELVDAGWTVGGSLGSPGSVLARDPDGSMFEFVEQPKS